MPETSCTSAVFYPFPSRFLFSWLDSLVLVDDLKKKRCCTSPLVSHHRTEGLTQEAVQHLQPRVQPKTDMQHFGLQEDRIAGVSFFRLLMIIDKRIEEDSESMRRLQLIVYILKNVKTLLGSPMVTNQCLYFFRSDQFFSSKQNRCGFSCSSHSKLLCFDRKN